MTGWAIGGGAFIVLVLAIIGLVDLIRIRNTMSTWQFVLWALLIVFIPVIGLIVYLFWRIFRSEAMHDALSVDRDVTPPDERPTIDPSRR